MCGRDATGITRDLDEIINELDQEHQMAPIQIELVENELAVVYMNSKKGEVRTPLNILWVFLIRSLRV